MQLKTFVLKAGAAVAPLLLTLALGSAQIAEASGSRTVVADSLHPTNCGKFHTADTTDLVTALNAAKKGKVLVCPGTYFLAGDIMIENAKGLTIAQAVVVKGLDTRPHIVVDDQTPVGIYIKDSINVTIKGLVVDSSGNTADGHKVLTYDQTSGKVLNTTLLGSATTDAGIDAQNTHNPKVRKLIVSKTEVRGYVTGGIVAQGPIKLLVTLSVFDGTDSGRLPTLGLQGVAFRGDGGGEFPPTGSVSKSTLRNNTYGVMIFEASRVNVSKNTLTANDFGVAIWSEEISNVTSKNKVLRNTISGVPNGGAGVLVQSEFDPVDQPMLKNVISKNVITSVPGGAGFGIKIFVGVPSLTTMTGTVSHNTVSGFMSGNGIVNFNNFAGFKIKGNTIIP